MNKMARLTLLGSTKHGHPVGVPLSIGFIRSRYCLATEEARFFNFQAFPKSAARLPRLLSKQCGCKMLFAWSHSVLRLTSCREGLSCHTSIVVNS